VKLLAIFARIKAQSEALVSVLRSSTGQTPD
jgi:hypothetical protein